MKAEDLTRLIAQGEGISLEFKRCGNQPQQVYLLGSDNAGQP